MQCVKQTRVDWKITKFIPDCSPVKKTTTVGQVNVIKMYVIDNYNHN